MSIDLKRTYASLRLSRPIAAGITVAQEGILLCSVLESGVEKATIVASPAGTEKVLGFSMLGDAQPAITIAVEDVVAPSSSPYELSLRNNNLVNGSVRAVVVGGSALTIDYTYAGTPPSGTVKVDIVNGKLKFASAQAAASVTVTYKYNLTVLQSIQLFGQRFVNNQNLHAEFSQLEVQTGIGELYTDQFDSSQDYTSSAALTLGANGIITKGGSGPALPMQVVHVPDSSNPYLGVRFNFWS